MRQADAPQGSWLFADTMRQAIALSVNGPSLCIAFLCICLWIGSKGQRFAREGNDPWQIVQYCIKPSRQRFMARNEKVETWLSLRFQHKAHGSHMRWSTKMSNAAEPSRYHVWFSGMAQNGSQGPYRSSAERRNVMWRFLRHKARKCDTNIIPPWI